MPLLYFHSRLRSRPGAGAIALTWLLLHPIDGFSLERGHRTPGFELLSLNNGQPAKLTDFEGKIIYVDFWASWCGPCRKSLPLYEAIKTEYPTERFEIVAINLDEDRDDAVRFLEKNPVTYTILLDPLGTTASQWHIQAMPSSFLLNVNGKVIKSWAGFNPAHLEEIQNEIRAALD